MTTTDETLPMRFSIAASVYFSPATTEGCIVLNLERGTVLSLNETSTWIFSQLAAHQEGLTRAELIETTQREFQNVEQWRVEKAVNELLLRLEKAGTISTHSADHDVSGLSLR